MEVGDRPMSISHLVHTLRAYAPIILLSMSAIALLYIVIAVAVYILSPAQRITTQKFRLDFEGAAEGRYPNGAKFSSSDIASNAILLKVYQDNHLDRFTTFPSFSRSVFVLEANPEYEKLAADYQSRLADPKLSAIDRERIQREWQSKSASLAKNDYSLNWMLTRDTARVPDTVVKKVLLDTLTQWARYATNEQRVLKYRLNIFGPEIIDNADSGGEPMIAIQVLRSKIYKVLQNVDALKEIPASELVRSSDGMSLTEIRLRLEEIVRFRLEPLAGRVASAGLIGDRPTVLRFLESQLAYDQRQLKATQENAEAIRQSMAVYSLDQRGFAGENGAPAAAPRDQNRQGTAPTGDRVVPQVSETFLDRLVTLTSQATDVQYRQKLVDEYRQSATAVIPAQLAVTYDQEVLNLVRNMPQAAAHMNPTIQSEMAATQKEVKQLVGRMNDVYTTISKSLNPSKELYTLIAPAVSRTEHSRSLGQLALYGVALLALSLPIIIFLCLLHARLREEEATETYAVAHEAEAVGS